MVEVVTKNLNRFPPDIRPSEMCSHFTIITGKLSPDIKEFGISFGSYSEVLEEHGYSHDTSQSRDTPVVCIGPTHYRKPSYFFMTLAASKRLRRRQCAELPMPKCVTQKVD